MLIEQGRWLREQDNLHETEALLERRVLERTRELEQEVAQRRRTEAACKETERLLHTALEFSKVAAWTWIPATDSITWDGPVEAVFWGAAN